MKCIPYVVLHRYGGPLSPRTFEQNLNCVTDIAMNISPADDSNNNAGLEVSPRFAAKLLSGHKKTISCMTIRPNQPNCLLTGSDDKTVRVWNVELGKTTKCIAGCFDDAIENITFLDENIICIGSGRSLSTFDIRFDSMLQRTPLSTLQDGFDDINLVIAHPKDRIIAVADDSGSVTIVPVSPSGIISDNSNSYSRHKKLSRVHTNIVGAIAYRKHNPTELVSGGYDCTVCTWDVSRGRPVCSTRIQHLEPTEGEEGGGEETLCGSKMLNPPFVFAVEYVCRGRGVLVGLGDGTVRTNPHYNTVIMFIFIRHCQN